MYSLDCIRIPWIVLELYKGSDYVLDGKESELYKGKESERYRDDYKGSDYVMDYVDIVILILFY